MRRFPDEPVEPIRPDDVAAAGLLSIPSEVIAAINELITENFTNKNRSMTIKQPEIIARALSKMEPGTHFNYKWLNFEPLFQSYGWNVHYDGPDYTESYDPFFVFTAK